MDLDYYDLEGLNIIEPGDDHIDIRLTSGQDFIMVNNVIVSVNSELPDATITIDQLGVLCEDSTMDVHYTVHNVNSTAALPIDTPIAFYIDDNLVAQSQTLTEIPIEGSESRTIELTIPPATPQIFTLKAVVDDDGTGNGVVLEINEDNNEDEMQVDLSQQGLQVVGPEQVCEGDEITLEANFTDLDFYEWFFNGNPYGGNNSSITVTQPGIYSVQGTRASCYVASPDFEIFFNPVPSIAAPPEDLFRCDNGIETGIFNLTQNTSLVMGAQEPAVYGVKYFESINDAENNINDITNPVAYQIVPPTPQTIYVRIYNRIQENCYELDSFELYYTFVEGGEVEPYVICDQDDDGGEELDLPALFDMMVLNGLSETEFNISYYLTQGEAESRTNALPELYTVPTPGQTLYIRIEPVIYTDCYDITTVDITVDSPPVVNPDPAPLVVCDLDNDGYAPFYLHDADVDISLGDPTLIITYHGTLENAELDLDELPEPYVNDDPWSDVVYARIEDPSTDCYSTVVLPLEVRLTPELVDPMPLILCEDAQGSGTAVFDLTIRELEMLDGSDPADYDFYYYEDQAEAVIAGDLALTAPDFSAAIGSPTTYTNTSNPQTIYVLAVGSTTFTAPFNGGEGCYDIVELELIVEDLPVPIQPEPYELCDDLESGSNTDQRSYFDLTSRNAEITDGDTTLTVTWFETFADEANDTPIADPTAYLNTATPQTVVARVSSAADCRALVTLTLIVNPVPNAIAPTPLVVCDADNEGYAYFMLTDKDEEISGGNPDILVSYHETEIDALNGVFPLASPFQNIVAGGQTVYARAFFADPPAGTGCFTVVPLELIVSPTPEMPVELPDLVECDIDGNEQAVFDLTQQDELIYGGQDPTLFDLTYHRTQAEAEQGIGAIASPEAFTNETNPQDIYARLGFIAGDGCYAIGKFTLIVAPAVPINDPDPLELCTPLGEPNTGTAIFDLTIKDTEITGGAAGLGVRYFLTEEDAQANENWIVPATAFENTENPQRIYVRVIDTNSECAAFTSLLLRVLPNPEPVTPAPIELCDADNSGTTEFDLTIREAEILNGEDWVISYFETYNDAVADENAIADPEQYENIENPQIIYVRVTNEVSGCFEIVELELIVRPIADVNNEITPYLICEINTTGVATFDLTTKIPEILGDLPPEDYLVTFYLSQVDEIGR